MTLEALLASLEQEPVTSDTPCPVLDVTPQTAEIQGCKAVTPVTANNTTSPDVWRYKYEERVGIIAEDTHNTLSVLAERLAFLETLVEYLQSQHRGIIAEFKQVIGVGQ